MEFLKSAFSKFAALGDRPDDSDEDRLRHRLLIYLASLMSVGGLMWGSIAASFDLFGAAIVPYGYVILSVLNIGYFRATKNFAAARTTQIFISLLLPFLFQFVLGGFEDSGAVMLWSLFALGGSLTLGPARQAIGWLLLFGLLTVASGFADGAAHEMFPMAPPASVKSLFFVLNITFISTAVFGLMIYLVDQREKAHARLAQANSLISRLNDGLEGEVAARTREVEEAFARFRTIIDNMVDGLVAVGTDGSIQAYNAALVGLLDLDQKKSMMSYRAQDVLPTAISELAQTCMSERKVGNRDIAIAERRLAACTASPVVDVDGGLRGAVVIIRDVTIEREVDRMKTEFTATVSHELRTPLTSVLGFTKITKNRLEEHILPLVTSDDKRVTRAVSQVRGNLDIIMAEGERLTALIRDVLDISKLESGKMEWRHEEVDPAELVERAAQSTMSLFDGAPVKLVVKPVPALPKLHGDNDRLLQVLINLISNARKFTDQGRVTLSVEPTASGVHFSVTDTGIGVPPHARTVIFDKFKQVGDTLTDRPSGTGLGLPICREIVKAHGGEIWIDSAEGEGSTFHFTIPQHHRGSAVSEATEQDA